MNYSRSESNALDLESAPPIVRPCWPSQCEPENDPLLTQPSPVSPASDRPVVYVYYKAVFEVGVGQTYVPRISVTDMETLVSAYRLILLAPGDVFGRGLAKVARELRLKDGEPWFYAYESLQYIPYRVLVDELDVHLSCSEIDA